MAKKLVQHMSNNISLNCMCLVSYSLRQTLKRRIRNLRSPYNDWNYGATNNYRTEGAFFDCSLHWKHKDKCGTHYIREKVLQQLVLQHIQMVTGYIYRHETHFRQVMEQQLHAESAKQIAANRKALERSEKRISELKRLFIKIYEDNASGNIFFVS